MKVIVKETRRKNRQRGASNETSGPRPGTAPGRDPDRPRWGTWNPSLQCLHLDKFLPEQQKLTLRAYKQPCACRVGANYGQEDAKRPKIQMPLLKSWEQKQGTAPKLWVGTPPKLPLQPNPWMHPYPHPVQGTHSPIHLHRQRVSKGTCCCSHFPLLQPCLNFWSGL